MACLPWWHTRFAALKNTRIRSGCSTSGGNVRCKPESMRDKAEAELKRLGYWQTTGTMPLATYTLARYAASEVGSGTPEEKVAVMEAAINRARGWTGGDVNKLLIYRQSPSHDNYGWYGPIHAPGGGSPYGRWAATSKDPGVVDLLIADFVMSGQSRNFARGAVTQYGPDVRSPAWARGIVRDKAPTGYYWVGPLPGVDHWHTLLFVQDKSISPSSRAGKKRIEVALAALSNTAPRPDWSSLRVCRKPRPVLYASLGVAAAGLAWWALSRTKKIPPSYRFPVVTESA